MCFASLATDMTWTSKSKKFQIYQQNQYEWKKKKLSHSNEHTKIDRENIHDD